MDIEWPVKGRLQQGMIFSNCLVSGYEKCAGWGLVITARCDLANNKVPVLNYLPVVRFEDWICGDGRKALLTRAASEEASNVEKLLKEFDAPESLLLGTDLPQVLDSLLSSVDPKRRKSLQSRCDKAAARYSKFAINSGPSISWLKAEFPKLYGALIKELMTQKLSGYYFLSRIEPLEKMSCYVVLLRQIGAMPSAIASRIPEGILAAAARDAHSGADAFLRFASNDEIAMPLGVLASPYVEHLMQTFSYLLTRIGLPNVDAEHINRYALVEGE